MDKKIEELKETLANAKEEVAKVIIGQEDVVDLALIAIFTHNHAIIEGIPGIAKTLLVRSLAQILGCKFGRIQFTPDLMPTDITGTNIYDMSTNKFSLVKGPVFTTFLLADEINRAPAKTQSALLQAMQERTVTIDNKTHTLDKNFTVFATQNPIEFEGTYPLPEAQKDRFMLKIVMSHPNRADELQLAQRMLTAEAPEQVLASKSIKPIITQKKISEFQDVLKTILVREDVMEYIVDVVRKTREHQSILIGAGPRATQALLLSSMGYAVINGRDYVIPDDIKMMSIPVLEHRIILRPEYEIEGLSVRETIQNILKDTVVPR